MHCILIFQFYFTILYINTSSQIWTEPLILPAQRKHSSWMYQTSSSKTNGAFPLHGTVRYGSVRFTFGGFSTGYSTWYLVLFITTLAEVPSDPYRYQNVTCKLYWSLIGWRKLSLPRQWTCDKRANIDPLDLNQHSQRRIGRNFCLNKRTFLYQPKNNCFVVCWGSIDVPLVDSQGADPARSSIACGTATTVSAAGGKSQAFSQASPLLLKHPHAENEEQFRRYAPLLCVCLWRVYDDVTAVEVAQL